MLLPQAWLRQLYLRHVLRNYPLYDPPHKVEEYLLSREEAAENFDYFMNVRQQRLAYFRDWLRKHFMVRVTMDERGVRGLNRWGNKYAGLLLVTDAVKRPTDAYFTYDPAWTGDYAGYNVLFDLGITIGEILISTCPKLRWDVDPISAILPRTAKRLKQTPGTSFQRPKLTGFDDPTIDVDSLHQVWGFAHQMKVNMTTFDGFSGYIQCPPGMRRDIQNELSNSFRAVLRDYPRGDPYDLRRQMSLENYLAIIDAQDKDDGDE